MSQKKYIDFLGDPAGKALRYTFHRAVEVKALVTATLISGCALAFLPPDKIVAPVTNTAAGATANAPSSAPQVLTNEELFFNTFLWNLFAIAMMRMDETMRVNFSKLDTKKKCIDTEPNAHTKPTSPDDLNDARNLRDHYWSLGAMMMAFTGYVVFNSVAYNGTLTGGCVNSVAGLATMMTRIYCGYRRFNKVLKDEWRIVSMPPPEKIAELERGTAEPKATRIVPVPT